MTDNNEQRMLNLGHSCKTKKFGTLLFRELYLEEIIELSEELISIASSLDVDFKKIDSQKIIFILLKKPQVRQALYKITAAMSDRKPEEFERVEASDWLKIIVTIKNTINWEELKELFFQIVPPEVLRKRLPEAEQEK